MIDLVGKRFGRLIVIEFALTKSYRNYWQCKCECGNIKQVREDSLKNGSTISCGCSKFEGHGLKHGYSNTRIYHIWENMLQRCNNPNFPDYFNYGGRGIKVCDNWLEFENFLKDMGECPSGYQIDRINNDGDYCKENCRWATRKEQNRNKRNVRLISFKNKRQCLHAWAEEYGFNPKTLWHRLYTLKWSIKKALTTPTKRCGRI